MDLRRALSDMTVGCDTPTCFASVFRRRERSQCRRSVLNLIELDVRRKTLLAEPVRRDGKIVYRFDIRLQGENETVFFDV